MLFYSAGGQLVYSAFAGYCIFNAVSGSQPKKSLTVVLFTVL